MKIELVVFDLAGTTVQDNRDVHRILQFALGKHGVTISLEDANAVMGIPKPIAIKQLLALRDSAGEHPDARIQLIHEDFVSTMMAFYQFDPSVKEKPGASELFKKLKQKKLKIVVDTGFDRAITTPLLERMGWQAQGLIDGSVTSDEVKQGRPHPDLIFKAMELTGIQHPTAVAKVGDTPSDLQEGKAAGCRFVIGVTNGAFTREQLRQEFHTHLIDNLSELESILI
jgi:phosphonatase-like hydrolase